MKSTDKKQTTTEVAVPESFNDALSRLQEVVRKLESDALPLEELMTLYQEGVGIADRLAVRLQEARLQIETIQSTAKSDVDVNEEDAF